VRRPFVAAREAGRASGASVTAQSGGPKAPANDDARPNRGRLLMATGTMELCFFFDVMRSPLVAPESRSAYGS
jgi:hypothetical protein